MTIGVTQLYRGLHNDHRSDTYSCIGASTMIIGVTQFYRGLPNDHRSDIYSCTGASTMIIGVTLTVVQGPPQ